MFGGMSAVSNIEIDLSNLKQDKKGNILWSKNIGELVPFIYNDEINYFKIISFGRQHITIECDGRVRKFHISAIYNNHIEPLLDLYTYKHLYDVGQVIDEFKIIEQIFIEEKTENTKNKLLTENITRGKKRGYKVECIHCGKQYEIKQKQIKETKVTFQCECQCGRKEE